MMNDTPLKLNLGCGGQMMPGFVNVDKFGSPDMHWDLEETPWPWPTSSVDEVILSHVLEHLGQSPDVYLAVMKELYRVCCHNAKITITVPHPRHDDFMTDPTHVRPITPEGLRMFSKALNQQWIAGGYANTPLGVYHDIDFEVVKVNHLVDEPWVTRMQEGQINQQQLFELARQFNNVIKQMAIELRVVKADA